MVCIAKHALKRQALSLTISSAHEGFQTRQLPRSHIVIRACRDASGSHNAFADSGGFPRKIREHSFEVQSELEGHLKTCDGKLLGVGLDCDGF